MAAVAGIPSATSTGHSTSRPSITHPATLEQAWWGRIAGARTLITQAGKPTTPVATTA